MKRLIAGFLSVCVAVSLLMTGCSSGGTDNTAQTDGPVTITIWHDKEDEVAQALQTELDTLAPDIVVKLEKKDGLTDSLKMVGNDPNSAPDMYFFAHDKIGVYAEMGILAPITDFVDKSTLDQYIPMTIEAATYKGEVYQLPIYFETLLYMYNRRYMSDDEVPSTTEELYKYKPGYLYAEGAIPVLLVAHMDTVHRQPVEQICYSEDRAVAMSPQGIGGDDRCGVWMILQILRTTNCHVLLCEDEEVGCIGAKKFTSGSLRPQVNYIVELDRRGSNDAVFYHCDNPEFEDFVTSFGFETAGGSCSDISYIAPYLETAAVNISCGYYCEHQRYEYIHLEEMKLNAARVAQMVTQQTEHFEYREQQDNFFGGRVYQYSMWDMASERGTYKWLSPLPKEAKIKLGTAELIMSHAKIDRQGKVHRYIPELNAAVQTENSAAIMPNGKKPVYDTKKSKCHKVIPLAQALELLRYK